MIIGGLTAGADVDSRAGRDADGRSRCAARPLGVPANGAGLPRPARGSR